MMSIGSPLINGLLIVFAIIGLIAFLAFLGMAVMQGGMIGMMGTFGKMMSACQGMMAAHH